MANMAGASKPQGVESPSKRVLVQDSFRNFPGNSWPE